MKKLRKRGYILGLAVFLLLMVLPEMIKADTGPKPSVNIEFEGLEGKTYFVTLLSETESTGPYSAVSESETEETEESLYQENKMEQLAFQRFLSYEDRDHFYFLQYLEDCSDTQQFKWGYYPPDRFKILLYFPEEDSFLTDNQIYERYAFRSYYTVKVQGNQMIIEETAGSAMSTERLCYYGRELRDLGIRMLITVLVELFVAWCFRFRKLRQIGAILSANVITQLCLNLALALLYQGMGSWGTDLFYIPLEIMVVLIEGIWYRKCFCKNGDISKKTVWKYVITANVASFVIGICLGFHALEFM